MIEVLVLLLLTVALEPPASWPSDYYGDRFFSRTPEARLSVLSEICKLEVILGESIPPEIEDTLVVDGPQGRKTVERIDDLAGCVQIDGPEDALEYLRLATSPNTFHLFRESRLEIYPKSAIENCILVCLPDQDWDRYSLVPPTVEWIGDCWKVRRTVMEQDFSTSDFRVFIYEQCVTTEGTITQTSEDVVLTGQAEHGMVILDHLMFPSYL